MSLLSSPYLPARISRSSKTGLDPCQSARQWQAPDKKFTDVSIVTAPWRLKTVVMVENIRSRMTMSLPSPVQVNRAW